MPAKTPRSPSIGFEKLGHERHVTAVAVTDNEASLLFFRGIFCEAHWTLHEVSCFREALLFFRRRPVHLVIADQCLADGSWRDVLAALKAGSAPPPLVVTCRLADEMLWAEVLNEGGFDVLAQPFDREEVVRVISAATRRMQNESSSRELVSGASTAVGA